MNEHDECENDHDGFYVAEPPAWKFSLWDVAGIALHTAAHCAQGIAQGFALMAQECAASANRARKTWDLREAERKAAEARAEMADDLRALMEGDGE